MKKAESTASAGQVLVSPVLIGLVLTLLFMTVGALAVNAGKLDAGFIPHAALASVGVGAFFCAFLAACRAGRSRFLWGLLGGAVLFALLLLASFLWVGEPIRLSRVLLCGGIALVLSCVGSLAGASCRRSKHRRK